MKFPSLCLLTAILTVVASPAQSVDRSATPTQRDLPDNTYQTEKQKRKAQRKAAGRLAKIDLDGDFNYDGTIQNDDPTDNGTYQRTPPGLVIGKGELSQLVLRVSPYQIEFDGDAVLTLEVAGINRNDPTGEFSSLQEEIEATGRIRVWTDASRRVLLLDSADPQRRYAEWVLNSELYPSNIPHIIPETVYAEGVKPSGEILGDLRILMTMSRRAPEEKKKRSFLSKLRGLGGEEPQYRTVFDHILVTVAEKPHEKKYVNENREKVWLIAQGKIHKPTPTGRK